MTSQVPSKFQSDTGLLKRASNYFRGLIGLFVIGTVTLVAYTLIQQHGCNAIIWWQQGDKVSCWKTAVTPQSLELKPGETASLNAQVTGTGYHSPEIRWTSQKGGIAFLDQDEGQQVVVQGKQAGKTNILVKIGVENQNLAKNSANFEIPVEVLPALSITPQELRIKEGLERQFKVNFTGIGWLRDKSISWQVANPDLLQIDESNRVKALKTGTTTLKAVWNEDPRVNQTIRVSVIENPPQITGIQLESDSQEFYVGETGHLNAQAVCQGNCTGDDTQVLWSSNYPDQAMISADGDLKALEPGDVTLTATSIIDDSQSRSINLSILAPVVTDVSIDPSPVRIAVDSQKRVQATLEGRGSFNKYVSWTSRNPKIAKVDNNGIVTGLKRGKTNLEGRSVNDANQKAVAEVYVTEGNGGCSP
ncbi:MAG: Ig-like domain-containing protein, partial [Sodalinema sp.]|uniref:Ig-like domain-containing protein n=1 Tax=Sodalinema sp. TaxID=3080550 RepID=UPI00396F32B6